MINYQYIKQRFVKNYHHYNHHATIQKQIVHQLIDVMQQQQLPSHYQSVLEIGCGTGYLTQQFLKSYQVENLYLNDIYNEIKNNLITHQNIYYLINDIQRIDLEPYSLDLILSSSALQWIYPLNHLLSKLYHTLMPQGYLVFSSYLQDNLWQIKQLTGQGLIYYNLDELCDLVYQSGFKILYYQQNHHQLLFNHPYNILKHLKYTGVTANQTNFTWNKQRLKQFENDYFTFTLQQNNQLLYPLTYHSVIMIAQKES